VDTSGTALAASCSGNLIAVADGTEGLAVVDITDPTAARIVRQIPVASLSGLVGSSPSAQAVATAADLAFVGTTDGYVAMVELNTGLVLQRISLGAAVQDLAIEGTTLYAYVSGRLHVLPFPLGVIQQAGSVPSPGAPNGRGRLFVGNDIAYVVHSAGYNTFSLTNPAQPALIAQGATAQRGWKQIVLNGAGNGLAAVGINVFPAPSTDNVYLYDTSDPTATDVFVTELETPGTARAVSIYNGLGYVADGAAGLQVVNYLAYDALGQPPSVTLLSSATSGKVSGGSLVVLRAVVDDDVQVRNVEFLLNGQRLALDGSFPFETVYRVPLDFVGTNIVFSAVAIDTGGNSATSATVAMDVVPDNEPPAITINTPTDGSVFNEFDPVPVSVTAVDPSGIEAITFQLNGTNLPIRRLALFDYQIEIPLPPGTNRLTAIARDFAGMISTSAVVRILVRQEAISREVSGFNFESFDITDAISREVSGFNFDPAEMGFPDAVSREFSVFNFEPLSGDAASREVSVFNFESPEITDAISREVSVQNKQQ
jgi:hypothetical protein